jgi:hypothetical protein
MRTSLFRIGLGALLSVSILASCNTIPDEGSLLEMTSKGDRYLVTIVDYDKKNRIVSLYREFQGARSLQTREPVLSGSVRSRGNRTVVRGSIDLDQLEENLDSDPPETLRYDLEYYHYDGTRWKSILSPEYFLKNKKKTEGEQ